MTKQQHTPGPWQVAGVRHSGDLKIGRDTRLHMVGPDGDYLAAVFFDMRTGRGLKDAHLIAAAPELLEALERATESECQSWCENGGPHRKVCNERRALIARARGGQA